MKSTLRKLVAGLCTAAMMFGMGAVSPDMRIFETNSAIVAEAAGVLKAPTLAKANIYSNKIELKVTNLSAYGSKARFNFFVNGNYAKSYSYSTLAKKNLVSLFDDGGKNFKANTTYSIRCCVDQGSSFAWSGTITATTGDFTYYKMAAGAKLYTLSGSKMTSAGKVTKLNYAKGVLTNDSGKTSAGKSVKTHPGTYIRINEGSYKGKYVKVSDSAVCRVTERTAKVGIVIQYAVGMDGGRYVWGGASYRACDCTGLTMLAYQQVGINISHSTYTQARMGKANTLANIKPGDIIICNNYGHAALYIGDGKMIHAMNTYYGIRIQDLSKISYCAPVNTVRTII